MNRLSLFDGMSCGQIAFNKIGVVSGKYYAAEIDKWAIQVTQANYPNTIQLGSVTEWREWDLDWSTIDFVSGGFPCQAWSMAGKQLGDKDERGMLFWVMLDIMKHAKQANPKIKFLIENVKMKKEFEDYITHHTEQALGEVNKVLINSALVSAQNRRRFYWTNWHVEQPEDKGIVLADVIEENVSSEFVSVTPDNHNNSNQLNPNYKSQANTIHSLENKMPTICAGTHGYALGHIPIKHDTPQRIATASDIKGHDYNKRIYSVHGKCPTLCAGGGVNLEPKILCGAIRGRYIVDGKRADTKVNSMAGITEQRLEVRKDEKTNTLTTVQKDNVVVQSYNRNDGLGKELDKSYPLNATDWRVLNRNQNQNAVVEKDKHYRKLTPTECERLQTVPDGYTNHVSNTQRYKMLGNGWTVDVIAHILKQADL
jgi:DNA-cytosine methyltransferase